MPYKIVQTIEGGEACLSVVPSKWEVNGTLYWPKKHLVAKLSLEEESVPSDKWEQLNCIKKREFSTRAEAYDELEKMEGKSDTEMDEHVSSRLPSKKARRLCTDKGNVYFDKRDFNELAEMQCQIPKSSIQTAPDTSEKILVCNTVEEVIVEPSVEQTSQMEADPGQGSAQQIIYVEPSVTVDNLNTNDSAGIIIASLTQILQNQSKTMQTLAKLVTHVEFLSQTVHERLHHQNAPTATAMEETIDPVNSLEALDILEASLKEDHIMQKYIRSMSFICGTSGKSNGLDCCYKLVDYFITRQFLLQCSWTGNTRAPGGKMIPNGGPSTLEETGKIGLKFYKKMRTLFLKLIMLADKDFSEIDCDNFFKRIMKNSKQRVVAKTATSKHRNRPKHIKYKDKKADETSRHTSEPGSDNMPPSDGQM